MSKLMQSVDSRTQLVGKNRLELLMFRLRGRQTFAINVFKVQEVLTLPKLTLLPHRHPVVIGVVYLRGKPVPVFDLHKAIFGASLERKEGNTIIVTEYNQSVQAFLVGAVDRIINMNWEEILPPPKGTGKSHYLTAFTRVSNTIVEIIDVEKVLQEVAPARTAVTEGLIDDDIIAQAKGKEILIVDDSTTAITQAKEAFSYLGLVVHECSDGAKGLARLKQWADEGVDVPKKLLMLVTDAEMPSMDGYRLTTEVRQDPRLKQLFIVLHTSLSGSFNSAMVEKVGCDAFISKFQPDELATLVQDRIRKLMAKG